MLVEEEFSDGDLGEETREERATPGPAHWWGWNQILVAQAHPSQLQQPFQANVVCAGVCKGLPPLSGDSHLLSLGVFHVWVQGNG